MRAAERERNEGGWRSWKAAEEVAMGRYVACLLIHDERKRMGKVR